MIEDDLKHQCKHLSHYNYELVNNIRVCARNMLALMDQIDSEEMSVAKTNIRTAVRWATKAIIAQS